LAPQSEPVASVSNAKQAPTGEAARATMCPSGWRQISAPALAAATQA